MGNVLKTNPEYRFALFVLLLGVVGLTPLFFDNNFLEASTPETVTYTTPGTYTFTVLDYETIIVKAWGGGGGGGGGGGYGSGDGRSGEQSSFNGTLVAGGGAVGGQSIYGGWDGTPGGAGGIASGGDINVDGSAGGGSAIGGDGGDGGSGANGGAGGVGGISYGGNGSPGTSLSGGGGGYGYGFLSTGGGGGGGGGYSEKVYSSGELSVGTNISVIVGAGGIGYDSGYSVFNSGAGASGKVEITYTPSAGEPDEEEIVYDKWGTGTPVTGFAWSDTIGWISMYCSDLGTCGTLPYGIEVDATVALFGHAWSDNIGWISAEVADTAGCPSAPCSASLQNGNLTGWMRVLSPVGKTESEHGGWDGWISLSDSNYGVTISDGAFSGYAWGSDVVGWIDFSLVSSGYQSCTAQYFCTGDDQYYRDQYCAEILTQSCSPLVCSSGACIPPLPAEGTITAIPQLVRRGETAQITWDVENSKSCTVTGNGDSWTGASGQETSSAIDGVVTYTLSCIGLDDEVFGASAKVGTAPYWREF